MTESEFTIALRLLVDQANPIEAEAALRKAVLRLRAARERTADGNTRPGFAGRFDSRVSFDPVASWPH